MLTEQETRFIGVRKWLLEQRSNITALARGMGLTPPGVRRLLLAETIPPHRHAQFIAQGVPEELLAPAVEKKKITQLSQNEENETSNQ